MGRPSVSSYLVSRIKLCIYDCCSYLSMFLCLWIMMTFQTWLPKHKIRGNGNTVKFIQIHHYSKYPWFSINFNKLQLNVQHFWRRFRQCEPRQSICPRNAVLSECSAGLVVLSAILVLLSVRRGDGSKIAKPMGFHGVSLFVAHELENRTPSLGREPASWKGDKPKGCDCNIGFHDIALHSEIQFPDGFVF